MREVPFRRRYAGYGIFVPVTTACGVEPGTLIFRPVARHAKLGTLIPRPVARRAEPGTLIPRPACRAELFRVIP